MLDVLVDSSLGLVLVCALLAALVALAGYMSPYRHTLAIAAPWADRFPLRTVARAALVAFVLLVNAAGLLLAHRLPLGSDLIAVGFLMLLSLPPDEPEDRAAG